MHPDLYAFLIARARGVCECGCKRQLRAREVDHFFGRAKAEESAETCWVLTPECHYAKTNNVPNADHWLLKFIAHCGRLDYAAAAARAQLRREWLAAMGPRTTPRATA